MIALYFGNLSLKPFGLCLRTAMWVWSLRSPSGCGGHLANCYRVQPSRKCGVHLLPGGTISSFPPSLFHLSPHPEVAPPPLHYSTTSKWNGLIFRIGEWRWGSDYDLDCLKKKSSSSMLMMWMLVAVVVSVRHLVLVGIYNLISLQKEKWFSESFEAFGHQCCLGVCLDFVGQNNKWEPVPQSCEVTESHSEVKLLSSPAGLWCREEVSSPWWLDPSAKWNHHNLRETTLSFATQQHVKHRLKVPNHFTKNGIYVDLCTIV